jgi:hypothetical protein
MQFGLVCQNVFGTDWNNEDLLRIKSCCKKINVSLRNSKDHRPVDVYVKQDLSRDSFFFLFIGKFKQLLISEAEMFFFYCKNNSNFPQED